MIKQYQGGGERRQMMKNDGYIIFVNGVRCHLRVIYIVVVVVVVIQLLHHCHHHQYLYHG